MTRIQLFTNTLTGSEGFLDVSQDIDIPITFGVAEIRDISKRTGAFSKTITLPGTKNNNELFGFYFDVNLSDGTYNINKLQTCAIINDGIVSVDYAFIQLISVRKRQNIINGDDIVEYDILIKDQVSNFFTRVASNELQDLSDSLFSQFNYNFTSENIVASFNNQYSNPGTASYKPYKYWLPYTDTDIDAVVGSTPVELPGYYTSDLQPAIFAKYYWDLIHQQAGYTYTWDSLSTPLIQFDKLLITDNKSQKDVNKFTADYNTIIATNVNAANLIQNMRVDYIYTDNIWSNGEKIKNSILLLEEIRDNSNVIESYDPAISNPYPLAETTSGVVVTNFPVTPNQDGYTIWTNNIDMSITPQRLKLDFNTILLTLTNINAFNVFIQNQTPNDNRKFQLWLELFNPDDDSIIAEDFIGERQFDNSFFAIPGLIDNLVLENDYVFTTDSLSLDIGDKVGFRFMIRTTCNYASFRFVDASNNPVSMELKLKMLTANLTITPLVTDKIPYNSVVPLSSYIPRKIKQSDFIKSICIMYNLYCVPDETNPSNLIWIQRDTFYDNGEIIDWTNKLDRSQWQEVKFLPDLTDKSITFTYKADTDIANTIYTNATKENYGQQKVIFNSEWVKTESTKELIFSPTPFLGSIWGGITPWYNNLDGTYNLRCLFDGPPRDCDLFIIDYLDSIGFPVYTGALSYNLTIHSNDEINPTFDINFGICDYYYTDDYNPTQLNLYNLYWTRTINQIDTSKLMTCYFNLSVLDVSNLKLNVKIKINNSYWNINRIIDFNYNKPSLTKVELISIDDSLIINNQ